MRLNLVLCGASLVALAVPAAAHSGPVQTGPRDKVQSSRPARPDGAGVKAAAPVAAPETAAPAPTTTLRDALVQAYTGNPELAGARANQRATDENVPIARSRGLPSTAATGTASNSLYNSDSSPLSPNRNGRLGLDVTVPVYNGGAVRSAVRAAEIRVGAGQANLRGTESSIFTDAVTAYVDVIRDEAIVRLNQQNVHVLEVNLQATRDRFEVGDLTRTDVAQSEARLAQAQAQLRSAEARLIGSRETYIRVIGAAPGVLAPPPPLPNLPTDAGTAEQIALAHNPYLEAAQLSRDASRQDVRAAKSSRLPSVALTGGGNYYSYLGSLSGTASKLGTKPDGFSATIGAQVSVPIFQGGRPAAEVRQAQAREAAAIENVTLTERGVVAQVRSAFASYDSALRVTESSRVAVEANRLSLEGVRAENSVGTRTILDILNAEQELLNSQVQYVTAQRDAYVAGFTLLATMGQAEAKDLGLDGGPLYDPQANYRRVRNRINDWRDDPEPQAIGTPTRSTPPQGAIVGPSPSNDPVLRREVDTQVDMRAPNP